MEGLDTILREATRWDVAAWFEGFGKIRRKGGELVTPMANVYQQRISEVLREAHERGRPARLVCLKPRQKGSSTFSVAALYRRMMAKPGAGLIAGGLAKSRHERRVREFLVITTVHATGEPAAQFRHALLVELRGGV